MKSKNIYLVYFLLTLFSIAIVSILIFQEQITIKDIGISLLTLFTTLLGATLAFRLNEIKEEKDEFNKQKDALNRALFVLLRQENALTQIHDNIAIYDNDFTLAFQMKAFKPPMYDNLKINIPELQFLLNSSNPHLLLELSIEQERFEQAIDSITIRNEFYINSVQPTFANKDLNKRKVTPNELQSEIGEYIYSGALDGARVMKYHVNSSLLSSREISIKLFSIAKELFPTHKFIVHSATKPNK